MVLLRIIPEAGIDIGVTTADKKSGNDRKIPGDAKESGVQADNSVSSSCVSISGLQNFSFTDFSPHPHMV